MVDFHGIFYYYIRMNITFITIGKLKEKFWQDAAGEYIKRLGRFCKLNVIELPESRTDDSAEESREILAAIEKLGQCYVIALDVKGTALSSEGLAEKIKKLGVDGTSHICFIIGGSNGFDDSVRKKAAFRLSFSSFTFPHQLMRVILLEQIYRAFKINAGEKYHK